MTSSIGGKSRTKPEEKIDESRLPDGGWGWMVVLGVAVTNMFTQSLLSVFGLLFGRHLKDMGYETEGITLVANATNTIMCFSGLITGPILKRFSCRSISIFGACLCSSGLILSSFATTLTEMLIFYSFLTGLGLGLIYPSTFVALKTYFVSKRARAVGLAMAGTGIGQMLMPQVVQWFLKEFGFCWAVRLIGVLSLHGIAGSMLYQPVQWHLKPFPNDIKKLLNNYDDITLQVDETDEQKKENNKKESLTKQKNKKLQNSKQDGGPSKPWYYQFHINILYDLTFVNIVSGIGLVQAANTSFSTIFPILLQENSQLRLSRSNTAMAMSLLSGADILSRVSIPWVMWKCGISSRGTLWWGALLVAGSRVIIILQTSLYGTFFASILSGYVRGMTVITQNLTISEYCSKKNLDDQLPAALGQMMVIKGIFIIIFGQFFGWLRDYTQSYNLFIHGINILLLLVYFTWGIEFIVTKIRRMKSNRNTTCER